MNSETAYRCWAEIDQSALRHNARLVRERIGARVELLAVVKADGYGHGLVGVSKALADEVDFFGVANLEEAMVLGQEVSQPIIILGPALASERPAIAAGGFIPSISTFSEAMIDRLAKNSPISINFVIDTGMGRMGVVQSAAMPLVERVVALPNIKVHSLSTHLPVSNEDADYTRAELGQFAGLVKTCVPRFRANTRRRSCRVREYLAFADPPFDIVGRSHSLWNPCRCVV